MSYSDPLVQLFLETVKGLSKTLWAQTIGRGIKEIDLIRAALLPPSNSASSSLPLNTEN